MRCPRGIIGCDCGAAYCRKYAAVTLCEDCPPVGYPTDDTRCLPCPRRPGADRLSWLLDLAAQAFREGRPAEAELHLMGALALSKDLVGKPCRTARAAGHQTPCLSALASGDACQPDETLKRCAICGFVVDAKFAAEKPIVRMRP